MLAHWGTCALSIALSLLICLTLESNNCPSDGVITISFAAGIHCWQLIILACELAIYRRVRDWRFYSVDEINGSDDMGLFWELECLLIFGVSRVTWCLLWGLQ